MTKGKVFDVFLLNSFVEKFEFIAPEFLFFEIGKHFGEIVMRGKLAKEELAGVFEFIKEQVTPVPFKQFNMYAKEAEELAPHSKDVQYFALALKLNSAIWSDEKAFKKQSVIKVFSTQKLKELL